MQGASISRRLPIRMGAGVPRRLESRLCVERWPDHRVIPGRIVSSRMLSEHLKYVLSVSLWNTYRFATGIRAPAVFEDSIGVDAYEWVCPAVHMAHSLVLIVGHVALCLLKTDVAGKHDVQLKPDNLQRHFCWE